MIKTIFIYEIQYFMFNFTLLDYMNNILFQFSYNFIKIKYSLKKF